MVKDYESQFQIKSLPPFIYNKKVHLKESDLNEIISGMKSLFPQYADRGIDFKMMLAGTDLRVMADIARMEEVLMHLIRNAGDAMPGGGLLTLKTKKISFDTKSIMVDNGELSGTCAFCSVSDTGTGMDGQTRERIFEPFFTTKDDVNKGLGLAIAYHIIRQHNGSMNVESYPGKGTTVNVYLPLLRIEAYKAKPIPLPASIMTEAFYETHRYQNNPL